MHEQRIEIRWRHVDAFHEVDNAVSATYFARVGDPWDYEHARGDR